MAPPPLGVPIRAGSRSPSAHESDARVRQQPGWVVLRPSGFMNNFLPPHPLGEGIHRRDEIRTSAGDGRVGWIDVHDVARAAAALLGDPEPHVGNDYHLTGPAALSYPEAAAVITAESGRPIHVQHLDVQEMAAGYLTAGLPPCFAASLAAAETGTRAGDDAQLTTSVLDLTGRPPRTFRDFVRRNLSARPGAH